MCPSAAMWFYFVYLFLFLALLFLGPDVTFEYIGLPLIGLFVRLVVLAHDVLDWCLAALVLLAGACLLLLVTLVQELAFDVVLQCLRCSLAL